MLASSQLAGSSSIEGGLISGAEELPDESVDKHGRLQDILLGHVAEYPQPRFFFFFLVWDMTFTELVHQSGNSVCTKPDVCYYNFCITIKIQTVLKK
jgi:hypothetical protein